MLMILSGCMGAGIWYSQLCIRKWRNLQNCQKALMILRNEIIYGRTPLPVAFVQMAGRTSGSVSVFFDTVSRRLEEGGGLRHCRRFSRPVRCGRRIGRNWRDWEIRWDIWMPGCRCRRLSSMKRGWREAFWRGSRRRRKRPGCIRYWEQWAEH